MRVIPLFVLAVALHAAAPAVTATATPRDYCSSLFSKAGDSCGIGKFCVPIVGAEGLAPPRPSADAADLTNSNKTADQRHPALHCAPASPVRVTYYRHGFSCGNAVSWSPSESIKTKLASLTKQFGDDASGLATGAVRDPALTDLGMQDSAAATCPHADFVMSSSMRRAMQTAHGMFPNQIVHVVPSIGEMDDESEGTPQVGYTAEELAMDRREQIERLCAAEPEETRSACCPTSGGDKQTPTSLCWANYSLCSILPAAPRAPVNKEATLVRDAVATTYAVLADNSSAAAWLHRTSKNAPSVCGNGWPVAANLTHFTHVLLPRILTLVPHPTDTPVTNIAVVTHSTTMKRSLQPLIEMDHWPPSNEGVRLHYLVQPNGAVTELPCKLLTCRSRLVSCGVPYRKHKRPWPCAGVKSCGASGWEWVTDAIACKKQD